jgi:hypothetical protein
MKLQLAIEAVKSAAFVGKNPALSSRPKKARTSIARGFPTESHAPQQEHSSCQNGIFSLFFHRLEYAAAELP